MHHNIAYGVRLDNSDSYNRIITYSDGGARGNPGPAGAGGQIQTCDGEVLAEISEYLGETTNNIAEYKALILTLERAREFASEELEIRADSELVVKQLNGEYKVKNEGLKPLFLRVKELIAGYDRVKIIHVYRKQNKRADELANEALDKQAGTYASRESEDPADRGAQQQFGDGDIHRQGTLF
jgi:ribonuclease HI